MLGALIVISAPILEGVDVAAGVGVCGGGVAVGVGVRGAGVGTGVGVRVGDGLGVGVGVDLCLTGGRDSTESAQAREAGTAADRNTNSIPIAPARRETKPKNPFIRFPPKKI